MKITYLNKIFYLIGSVSIFISLFFNIDSAGSGGFVIDFSSTWPLVENPLNFNTNLEMKFPLHYYIASLIYLIVGEKELLRLVYCFIGLFVPFLFFICLKKKFKNIDKNNLFLFSLIIFLLPSFRSSIVWPNTQITGMIFFLISLYYFLEWEIQKKFNYFSKPLFLTIFFMSLTVYSRQIYAIIFIYFVIIFFIKLKKKIFLVSCSVIGLFASPGIVFVYFWPRILKATFDLKLYNSLVINASIISLYLIPFFSIIYFFTKERLSIDIKKKTALILCILFVCICSLFFDYNYYMGGGFFIKLSVLLFDNLIFFFITSILGFYLLFLLTLNNNLNTILILLILFGVSAYIIFMKYFEPMFILVLFLLLKTKYVNLFLVSKKNIYLYHGYFLIYLSAAIVNNFFLLTK